MSNLIGQSLGRYHILEQLGEGGMATVYKAYDTRLERDVAVKIIRRKAFPEEQLERILKRFEREAKALARLTHPNIVGVIDYGEHEGAPYLVMPYLPGGTLKQRLGKPMPWQEAVRLLLPIAQALEYAHEHAIIHRDIKPSNILLTEKGQPMLSDFGIAKILENDDAATLTGTGVGVGTPEYMAPEQWTGAAGPQSDIYSLGVVLYELVTGRKPYTADTPAAILLKQASEPLPRPGQFVRDLPEAVEKALIKALARKPDDRYTDMGQFAVALDGLLNARDAVGVESRKVQEKSRKLKMEDSMATIEQDNSQETRLQEATRDEIVKPPAPPAKTKKQPSNPALPERSTTSGAKSSPSSPGLNWKRWIPIVILVAILGIGLALGGGLLKMGRQGQGPLAGLATKTATPTNTPTSTPTRTPTPTITLTPTPTPHIGSTWTRPADGMVMVYVPAGNFSMGKNEGYLDEQPVHTVSLDAFWIDQTEVTNAMYAQCVQAGVCQPPSDTGYNTRGIYYGNSQYADYPVIFVDWYNADTYCQWADAHLPSEAEWEKAARGMDGRTYPWGDAYPTCSLLNHQIDTFLATTGGGRWIVSGCIGDTSKAGSYPSGASPYGALDMAGNVKEWVADWYDPNYYANSPASNPTGPASGQYRVLRGGSWNCDGYNVRSANRYYDDPARTYNDIGFRCVLSP